MNLSGKLILFLTVAVGIVMIPAGYFILHQREDILSRAFKNELHAHAITLKLTLKHCYQSGGIEDGQRLVDRLSGNPSIYSVILFNEDGDVVILSNPLVADRVTITPEVRSVMSTGKTIEQIHRRNREEVFSIILPLRMGSNRRGALEISQRMDFIRADYAVARREIAILTLALFASIVIVVLLVMRYKFLRPIKDLLIGARAVGCGDLSYRVLVPKGGKEITELASEFNRMAISLAEQRVAAESEAEERLMLERELRHTERLASVGRLAAGIAHQMGTPLNVIKGRVELLLARTDSDDLGKRFRNLNIIEAQADTIADVVRQLLLLARPFKLRCDDIDLSQLIAEVVELLEVDARESGIFVEVDKTNQFQIQGDKILLHQVLMNVCVNALHAMKSGGYLSIGTLKSETINNSTDFIGIRISDTGTGISLDNLSQIFDPFFTTKDIGEGTGLGLSVAHRIVDEHGGRIEVNNRPEGGSTFIIWLPVHNTNLKTKCGPSIA